MPRFSAQGADLWGPAPTDHKPGQANAACVRPPGRPRPANDQGISQIGCDGGATRRRVGEARTGPLASAGLATWPSRTFDRTSADFGRRHACPSLNPWGRPCGDAKRQPVAQARVTAQLAGATPAVPHPRPRHRLRSALRSNPAAPDIDVFRPMGRMFPRESPRRAASREDSLLRCRRQHLLRQFLNRAPPDWPRDRETSGPAPRQGCIAGDQNEGAVARTRPEIFHRGGGQAQADWVAPEGRDESIRARGAESHRVRRLSDSPAAVECNGHQALAAASARTGGPSGSPLPSTCPAHRVHPAPSTRAHQHLPPQAAGRSGRATHRPRTANAANSVTSRTWVERNTSHRGCPVRRLGCACPPRATTLSSVRLKPVTGAAHPHASMPCASPGPGWHGHPRRSRVRTSSHWRICHASPARPAASRDDTPDLAGRGVEPTPRRRSTR